MAVTLQQLHVFRTVVLHGRIGLAAAALNVSQPSVSQQIRRLEEDLGFSVLEKGDGRLTPTERGRHVLQIADLFDSGVERLRDLSEEAKLGPASKLVVGANATGGMYLAPELIRAFQRKYPQIVVAFQMGSVNSIAAAISGGVCDVGVVGGPIASRDYMAETLFTDVLPLVASPADPLAGRRSVPMHELLSRTFVMPGLGSRTRLVVESALRRAGIELKRVIEYPDTETVKKAVEAGLGIAYLSREGVRRELQHGYLAELHMAGLTIERPFQAFWLRGRATPGVVDRFVESARRQIALREAHERRMRRAGGSEPTEPQSDATQPGRRP